MVDSDITLENVSRNYPTEIITQKGIELVKREMTGELVAIIDVDGTVADTMATYCEELNLQTREQTGIELNYTTGVHTSFAMHETISRLYPDVDFLTPDFVYGIFNVPSVYSKAPPIQSTAVMVKALRDLGYRIVYATSRPTTAIATTQEWLERYEMPIDYLLFEDSSPKKKDLIESLAPVVQRGSFFYDDRPQTLVETAEALSQLKTKGTNVNIDVFGPHTPWNDLPGSTDPDSQHIQHLLRTPNEIMSEIFNRQIPELREI
jgi:hypothetical protein